MENKNNISAKISPLGVVFIVFQIIFIISIIISLFSVFQDDEIDAGDYEKQPRVTIENLQEVLPNPSSEEANTIERNLLQIMKNNTNDINLNESVAVMREVKERYFEYENVHFLSFIVDISDLRQSYQIFYQYSDDENNKYIGQDDTIIPLCLSESEEIFYSEFECKDLYSQTTRNAIVSKYLGFFDFEYFSAFVAPEDLFEIKINPIADGGDDSKVESYIGVVKQSILSLGISPEVFKYSVVRPEELTYFIEE